MPAGVRKIPIPTTSPTTSAVTRDEAELAA